MGKSGTFTYCKEQLFRTIGNIETATGTGSYESVGKHSWRTFGTSQLRDGSALISEGEIDLATRPRNVKLFEKN